MNGQLTEHPLAELIHDISTNRLTGALRLEHDAVKTVIYCEAGQVVYAATNLRELRLGEYLTKRALVSEEQIASLGNNLSDLALAAALGTSGAIDRGSVTSLFSQQVTDLLSVVLLWTKGTWNFDERTRLGDPLRLKIDVVTLLLETARKLPPKFVSSRIHNREESISPVTGMPDFGSLSPAEGFVLSRVDSPVPLGSLIAMSGLPEAEALRTIYGLALSGFIEREHWPMVLSKSGDPVRVSKAPVTVQKVVEPEPVPPTAEETEESVARDLEDLFRRLEGASTHYEVLNVDTQAGRGEIKTSYYALARRYHPDRFHLQAGTAHHMRIEAAFAKIAQAYVTLSDSALRRSYNGKLKAREKMRRVAQDAPKARVDQTQNVLRQDKSSKNSVTDDLERAEAFYQEGFAALEQGQTQAAITNLAAAARIFPKDARFRAYYGRALAAQEETRRLAETEMHAAIKLEPGNTAYRVMLAELYCDLGFFLRAEAEVKRVLSTEPNNPSVRKLMQRLEGAHPPSEKV